MRLLIDDLRKASNRGVPIRILTSDYLGITSPAALCLLRGELGHRTDIRIYTGAPGQSFHPKAYFFHHGSGTDVFVGSSNVSSSALKDGIEWNYKIAEALDPASVAELKATFEDLFGNHAADMTEDWLREYQKRWRPPAGLAQTDAQFDETSSQGNVRRLFTPRGAQTEAMYALSRSRDEGADRGIVCVATGVGKTFLAAFDSIPYKRVLFVAHRNEILHQAAAAFHAVRPDDSIGFFNGDQKDTDAALTFASVATLGGSNSRYLSDAFFSRDSFDYIVIDEFHHAVASSYQSIVNYFEPRFLLGLTATPERMDERDIYQICDYNVPYELSLFDAISRRELVPFRYYGIYDETDYSSVTFRHGNYDAEKLTELYTSFGARSDLIYRHFRKHRAKRALGFCCSHAHAEYMAEQFLAKGVRAAAVHSGTQGASTIDRSEAIGKLMRGELEVIFCVDMFNEGVDIPALDTVMFLRPTESPTVFLQQLGRGLRKYGEKDHLTVLDFIGNYEQAGRIPSLLTGQKDVDVKPGEKSFDIPGDCIIDLDLQLIDLLEEMRRRARSEKELIADEYRRVRDILGHVPSRIELVSRMDASILAMCELKSGMFRGILKEQRLFRDYLGFLAWVDDLADHEQAIRDAIPGDFINLLETTDMTRVYKIPVLQAFLAGDRILPAVTEGQVLASWKRFFSRGDSWKDLGGNRGITHDDFLNMTDEQHLRKIQDQPVKALLRSSRGFFRSDEEHMLILPDALTPWLEDPVVYQHAKDVLDYRADHYFRRRYRDRILHDDAVVTRDYVC